MIRRLAVVPARGGSKRIPFKNIKDFCGQPMISYILKTAKQSNLFDLIHVSTESSLVANVVNKLGYDIDFMRPKNIANDDVPIRSVLKYVVDEYQFRGFYFDEVWLLMACAPLVMSADLVGASKLFELKNHKHPVLAVGEYPTAIERAFAMSNEGVLNPLHPGSLSLDTKSFAKQYFDAGAFAVFPSSVIESSAGAGDDFGYLGYVLPKVRVVDIDEESDWLQAEIMYQAMSVAS